MWISKRRLEGIEKKIADLEEEQLSIRSYAKEVIKSDEDLIEIVKKFRAELLSSKITERGSADGEEKKTYSIEKLYADCPSVGEESDPVEVQLRISLVFSDWCKFRAQPFYWELIQYLDNV